jgi:predicted Zn-dependent peptidase
MLTNESKTGLIDSLVISQQIMEAQAVMDNHYDEGGVFILFVPKLVMHSVNNAEKKILSKINIIKNNKFNDNLLKSCKNTLSKRSSLELENSSMRLSKIIDAYMLNVDLKHVENYNRKVINVTRNDIVRVANKYFGDNYLSFQSKTGFKKKNKLDMLKQSPLNLVNKNSISKAAKFINNMDANNIEPKFINFHTDVVASDIKNGLHFYYTKNPLNNVFSLRIRIGYGKLENPKIEQLAFYLNNSGTNKLSYVEFSNALQLIGSNISFDVDNDYFNITIDGFDNNFDKTLVLLKDLLNNFSEDKTINKKMIKNNKIEYKILKKDINSKSKLLEEYALYGEKSSSLHKLTNKELKKIEYSELKTLLNYLLKFESYIHYVGTGDIDKIKESIMMNFPDDFGDKKSVSPIIRKLPILTHNKVYYLKDKNAVQTHLKYNIPSRAISMNERAYLRPFNKYFGLGMNSVLFREVREFRSLAYNVYGYYSTPYKFTEPGFLRIGLSTQADKTIDASSLIDSLLNSITVEERSIYSLRSYLINSINSDTPSFRNKSNWVQYWQMQGYTQDPRILFYSLYSNLKKNDVEGFYTLNVKERKYILSIVGDSKRFDLEKLKINSEFKEVKLKNLIRQ